MRDRFNKFLDSPRHIPLLAGFISGLYPFLFFYSNNYTSVNSWQHAGFFFICYVVTAMAAVGMAFVLFSTIEKLKPYKAHLLFVLPVMVMASMLSYAMFFTFKKKVLLALLIILVFLSLKLHKHYKRLLALIVFMALMPLFKVAVHIYEDVRPMRWAELPDDIVKAKFRHRPNIYMIQPDGYAGKSIMEKPPYSYTNDFYGWLENNGFKVYEDFRSNYPASLTSNASMFAMKHHYFDAVMFPAIEMPRARKVILDNSAVKIFKNNGYTTYFLAEDEYFQQNLSDGIYDYYNIKKTDIPLSTNGGKLEREVFGDLEFAVNEEISRPKFVFVEKVLPHHIHFDGTGIEAERKEYLEKTQEANNWLKKAIALIESKDKNAVIIILSDHGGWVGTKDITEFHTTDRQELIRSAFGNMAAIRWNGVTHDVYDLRLRSSVNVFRVLFSALSENTSYLEHLEKDESYNIHWGSFNNSVHKVIDANGKVVREKH